ncbi:MAG: C39 family peptidase [Patescibacteria group bacterium]
MIKFARFNLVLFFVSLLFLGKLLHPQNSLSSFDITNWTNKLPVGNQIASQYALSKENNLYSIGGANNSTLYNASASQIQLDGNLNLWIDLDSKPSRYWHSGANQNQFVYLLGGANINWSNTNSVLLGVIDSTGDINSWSETTPLPYALSLGQSVIYNNRIYFAGGSTRGEATYATKSEIWMSDINSSDGTLVEWSLAGYLPQPTLGFGMVEHNGYLIIMGGKNSDDLDMADVQKAQIDPTTGEIGPWTVLPSLPDVVNRLGVTKVGNLVITAGGRNSSQILDTVNFSEIDNDGNIVEWKTSPNKLPVPTCCFALTSWNDYLYMIGGYTGSYVADVYMSKVEEVTAPPFPVLSVPDLKQYSLPWKNKIYDHKNASIEKFGCALTAASMVLQYHGHNIMPDDLNNWLKNEPDGYLKNGLINWLAISRYTKENYSPSSRTLEYKGLDPTTENLDNELNNDRPAILKEPGHFVVATGKTTDSYLINDPGYSDRTDLSSYGNSFLKINSYTPTDSDLSYMMFVTDPDIDLEIASSSGLILPIDSFVEDPITNLLNFDKKSGNPVKIYLFEKPETGKYALKATGPKGKYNLESYLYNTDGKVTKNSFDGRLNGNDTDSFNISFEGKNKIKEADKKPYCKFFKKYFWKNWR